MDTTFQRITVIAVMAVAVTITACRVDMGERSWSDGGSAIDEERQEEAVPVEVVTLERGEIEAVLRFSANLEAERSVQVFAEAPRRVEDLLVEEGDLVSKGDLLIRLQNEEQVSALAKVESQLRQARREYDRQESLYGQKLISEQVFIDARYEVEQLELALEDAKRELTYTEVRASIGGTITERMVNLGDQVSVNQALFRIVDFSSIVARIYVPEKELISLRRGQPARLAADAIGGRQFSGKIERISPVVDPSSGTVKVTVATPRQEGLRPGMYVSVEVVTAVHPEAVLAPKKALVYDNDQIFVFVLGDQRRVKRVAVVPILSNPEFIEPGEQLSEGDEIVVAGQAGLKDGALVRLPGDPKPEAEDDDEDSQTDE